MNIFGRNTEQQNKEVIKRALWENPEMVAMKESYKAKFGHEMTDAEKFPVLDPSFSWKKLAGKFGVSLREAEVSSGFTQVLRAGIQNIVNSAYETVDTSFEKWVHVVQSSKLEELYAPLQGIGFLREVASDGGSYPEVKAAGLDIKLRNKKYGAHFAVSKELMEDDQTGQFSKQVALMGQYAKLVLEVLCYAKFLSVDNMAYGELTIPKSETQPTEESNYPWSTALVGGGRNRPNSYGALDQGNIQNAFVGLMNQKNKLGLKMMVRPDKLIHGPAKIFDLSILLNSAFYPSVPSGTPGTPGTNYANNPIKGLCDTVVSRFMFKNDGTVDGTSTAWALIDSSVPFFVAQIRQGAEVIQENPASGESFNRDIFRFKVSLRGNADFIDPRFAWLGSDGSA